ncbi:putative Mg2+ transporter-C (MgtC) family protein [Parabacteroides sp. PFB2-12]|uniref:MgtC/SapB family protein n=1 Tax=unclassified Parabacteroides TaxID=2649774 RepID=UPI002476652A|nr:MULTISPECIES: MgtC/SapB family protein [unclassified Parabacteroides]MDH6343421.1 putative Mg2+ transporter-C (MgtC) family protein [Parabacteroides sp. PM6-13]MDH6391987.1 putative Mg2+ transporter-C (MgtC) family protein [Parabacteroides sp. PFB2-12]
MLEELKLILESTIITPYTIIVRLIISFFLGGLIGVERQMRRRDAGMRTFTLICLGSTAAMLISIWIPQTYPDFLNGDPGRIAAQVLTGIGFLGAGAIIQNRGGIQGLTTAACIWVVAVVGLAVGAGMYLAAGVTTLATLFVLLSMEKLEKRMYLDGVNKILTIHCSIASPNLKAIRTILENQNVYIVSFSYEIDYEKNKSTITYKVNVRSKSSYSILFAEVYRLGYISQIRLLA